MFNFDIIIALTVYMAIISIAYEVMYKLFYKEKKYAEKNKKYSIYEKNNLFTILPAEDSKYGSEIFGLFVAIFSFITYPFTWDRYGGIYASRILIIQVLPSLVICAASIMNEAGAGSLWLIFVVFIVSQIVSGLYSLSKDIHIRRLKYKVDNWSHIADVESSKEKEALTSFLREKIKRKIFPSKSDLEYLKNNAMYMFIILVAALILGLNIITNTFASDGLIRMIFIGILIITGLIYLVAKLLACAKYLFNEFAKYPLFMSTSGDSSDVD